MSIQSRWKDIHTSYKKKPWINQPSLFANEVISYLPAKGKILDLGAGLGQDSRFFAEHGYEVISTDMGEVAQSQNRKLSKDFENVKVEKLVLSKKFPYKDSTFDVVYAHLSLHYFDDKKTTEIFEEINRVLRKGGLLAFFTNSTKDPEFNTGKKIENNYFEIEHLKKRYFDIPEALKYTKNFETLLCDNKGETYKDREKGIHGLIRYIGKK